MRRLPASFLTALLLLALAAACGDPGPGLRTGYCFFDPASFTFQANPGFAADDDGERGEINPAGVCAMTVFDSSSKVPVPGLGAEERLATFSYRFPEQYGDLYVKIRAPRQWTGGTLTAVADDKVMPPSSIWVSMQGYLADQSLVALQAKAGTAITVKTFTAPADDGSDRELAGGFEFDFPDLALEGKELLGDEAPLSGTMTLRAKGEAGYTNYPPGASKLLFHDQVVASMRAAKGFWVAPGKTPAKIAGRYATSAKVLDSSNKSTIGNQVTSTYCYFNQESFHLESLETGEGYRSPGPGLLVSGMKNHFTIIKDAHPSSTDGCRQRTITLFTGTRSSEGMLTGKFLTTVVETSGCGAVPGDWRLYAVSFAPNGSCTGDE